MAKRNPPAHSVTWMKALALEKRNKTQEELKYLVSVAKKQYRVARDLYRKTLNRDSVSIPDILWEALLDAVHESIIKAGFTEENFQFIQRQVIFSALGDPVIMSQSNGLRQHAKPYWNPTRFRLNVAPMGLVESVDAKTREAKFVDFVDPGAHIMIPDGYTVGGKYSTVFGVAPQLKPLPRVVDESNWLDLAPLTYTEWCTYTDNTMSECCKTQATWHEKGNCLICAKCGKGIKGIPE